MTRHLLKNATWESTLQIPPDSRFGGAQKHFGHDWTTGQMVVAGVMIAAVVAFAIFLGVSATQKNAKKKR